MDGRSFLSGSLFAVLVATTAPGAGDPAPARSPGSGSHADAATPPASAPTTPRARAEALYEEGRTLVTAGRLEEAAARFERALGSDPMHGDARTALGWVLYRLGRFAPAADTFEETVRREPKRADAWTGLGYARLQTDERARSREAFSKALELMPKDTDATKGLALLTLREGRAAQAAELFREVLAAAPGDAEARAGLTRALTIAGVLKDRTLRPAPPLAAVGVGSSSAPLAVRVRAGSRYFELRDGKRWRPILVKGVNLGVALPGKFPAEFPEDEKLYRDWLGKMRAMNVNAVRVYTLLPPVFYAALAAENRAHPGSPLRLVQGVWVELPPGNDFGSPEFNDDYAAEIRRVIDAVHGNIEVAPRPGHASGRYDADVSAWLLGFILGREWEPYAVEEYERRVPASAGRSADGAAFEGTYVRTTPSPKRAVAGTGMGREAVRTEAWIASTLETAAAHLARNYGESWPLAFTNWPTLDPLDHPTEATRAEEDAILARMGRPRPPEEDVVYDNDAWSVDVERMNATPAWPAGLFASYHAYPYFPDFMILDPGYLAARDAEGPNAYAGYLRDLVRHHAGRPVIIAEFGVPSSRGVAHRQPQGFDHGGHDESAQARIDARLFRTIRETGCAGGILFSWMDEWFKHNWLFQALELPRERKPLWLNALDPEEHFGILAADPASARIVLDGKTDDWKGIAPYFAPREGRIRALYAASDEAYLYLRLDTAPLMKDGSVVGQPGSFRGPWDYWIGIDTYDRAAGDRRLPRVDAPLRIGSGLEFAIHLSGSDARILVDAPYDIGTHRNEGPYASVANSDGRFIDMAVEIRMERIARSGQVYPAERHNMSELVRGTTELASPGRHSLADYALDPVTGVTELRIPWGLLNVTDPSSRRVVHQTKEHAPPIDTTVTDGFVFYVAAVREGESAPADERPRAGETAPVHAWPTWEAPKYRLRLKPVYESMKKEYGRLGRLAP
jgi:tetratricopeptide (TPR) repeat protein